MNCRVKEWEIYKSHWCIKRWWHVRQVLWRILAIGKTLLGSWFWSLQEISFIISFHWYIWMSTGEFALLGCCRAFISHFNIWLVHSTKVSFFVNYIVPPNLAHFWYICSIYKKTQAFNLLFLLFLLEDWFLNRLMSNVWILC